MDKMKFEKTNGLPLPAMHSNECLMLYMTEVKLP